MPEDHAFWRFSIGRYQRPGVPALCLEAQRRHDADVNLLLFGLWLGSGGQRATRQGILRAQDRVAGWHSEVVRALRHARSWMKQCQIGAPQQREALREDIKRLEIEAERQEQDLLFALWQEDRAAGGGLFPQSEDSPGAMAGNLAAFLGLSAGDALVRDLAALCA